MDLVVEDADLLLMRIWRKEEAAQIYTINSEAHPKFYLTEQILLTSPWIITENNSVILALF